MRIPIDEQDMQNPLYCPLLLGAIRWLGQDRDDGSWFIHYDYLDMFFDMSFAPIFKRNDIMNYMCDAGHLQPTKNGYVYKEKEGCKYVVVSLETVMRFLKCCMYEDLFARHFKLFCYVIGQNSSNGNSKKSRKFDIREIPAKLGYFPSVESEERIMDMLTALCDYRFISLEKEENYLDTEFMVTSAAVRSI